MNHARLQVPVICDCVLELGFFRNFHVPLLPASICLTLRLHRPVTAPIIIAHATTTQVWNTNGVEGVFRFLARAWRLFADGVTEAAPDRDQLRLLHLTIKRVRTTP